MENTQYSNNKEVIICPIVAAWIFFLINLILYINLLIDNVIIFLFLILYHFVVALLLTLSIERDKYSLFFASFIMTIIYDVIITIVILIILIAAKGKDWYLFFIYTLIQWVLFVILIVYKKKVLHNIKQNEAINEPIKQNMIQI